MYTPCLAHFFPLCIRDMYICLEQLVCMQMLSASLASLGETLVHCMMKRSMQPGISPATPNALQCKEWNVTTGLPAAQEPKLTTAETVRTPMTLLLVLPKHSESEHRPKPLRCGHKPPEETALTGETSGVQNGAQPRRDILLCMQQLPACSQL